MTEEELRILENIKWKSVDKDNMEFETRVSTYQVDALNKLIKQFKDIQGRLNNPLYGKYPDQ